MRFVCKDKYPDVSFKVGDFVVASSIRFNGVEEIIITRKESDGRTIYLVGNKWRNAVDIKCQQCNFEEHCYFGIRKLSKDQFFMLADKFHQIKKVNAPDIKFGSVVTLQTRLLKIKPDKLRWLRAMYGKCLSERQIQQIQNKLYNNESEDKHLTIDYEDLEIVDERIMIGIISGINLPFGCYFTEYSTHCKDFIGSNKYCVHYVHKPSISLSLIGKDFEDYSIWAEPEIIEILSPEESKKYLDKDFYSLI